MVEIKPLFGGELKKILSEKALSGQDICALQALEKGERTGVIIYEPLKFVCEIRLINLQNAEDEALLDGLIRAVGAVCEKLHLHLITCMGAEYAGVLQKIGFINKNGKLIIETDKLAGDCCGV